MVSKLPIIWKQTVVPAVKPVVAQTTPAATAALTTVAKEEQLVMAA